jgi:hypothetical protein
MGRVLGTHYPDPDPAGPGPPIGYLLGSLSRALPFLVLFLYIFSRY